MQSAQVVTLKSGQQNASSVDSKSPMHSFELRLAAVMSVFSVPRAAVPAALKLCVTGPPSGQLVGGEVLADGASGDEPQRLGGS